MVRLIKISKDERFYLESKGFKMHQHIIPTYTRYRHYFAVEDYDLLKCLIDYRKKLVGSENYSEFE